MPDSDSKPVVIFWFRRDLRLHDNRGLFHALNSGFPVLPVFIFDKSILDLLESKSDSRVTFIHQALEEMHKTLEKHGSGLHVEHGYPHEVLANLVDRFSVEAVYTNHDYEPQAIERDKRIGEQLRQRGIAFHTFKDQVVFEKEEVIKDDGNPYTVYTPYMKKWRSLCKPSDLAEVPSHQYIDTFIKHKGSMLSLAQIGFEPSVIRPQGPVVTDELLKQYAETRDYPGVPGTSRMSVHLRFGTVSIRELARISFHLSDKYFNELIWREFYMMILYHFPQVVHRCFKPSYESIKWRNNEAEFKAWCEGKTGYPMVDAGMRELVATGYMHNRVRMVVASFLTKHLLIDWRWGEAFFARHLLDFELASNNGGWQWSVGCGCDAAPYFRVFNPAEQLKKFDGQERYIRKWIPEIGTDAYPQPIVNHALARERVLEVFKKALTGEQSSKMNPALSQ